MLSIIIANFNEYKNLNKCLSFLNKQKNVKFEVIISEGKRKFKKIKKKYKFKLYQHYNEYPQNQEARTPSPAELHCHPHCAQRTQQHLLRTRSRYWT